jgi:hypothetical protein
MKKVLLAALPVALLLAASTRRAYPEDCPAGWMSHDAA